MSRLLFFCFLCFVVLVVNSYRWSFSSCPLRSFHWAYESACFVRAVLLKLVDEGDLPSVTEVRACLELDVDQLRVSGPKLRAMRDEFGAHLGQFAEASTFDDHLASVQSFMFEEMLSVNGVREEVTFHLSVGCPAVLLQGDVPVLQREVERFTALLVDLKRIGPAEKTQMDGSFAAFVTNFRQSSIDVPVDSASVAVDILRACGKASCQRFFRYLMCLSEAPLFPLDVSCASVGGLSSDVTTSVCSSILSYLKTHSVRQFESVSGPLLEDIVESTSHFTDLSELSEEMLWDDVGVVADEEYRQSVYALIGFRATGERAASPEV